MSVQAEVRAQEVQAGLWLLQQALALLQRSVTNVAMHGHIDSSIRNLLSTTAVIHSLNFQVRLARGPGRITGCSGPRGSCHLGAQPSSKKKRKKKYDGMICKIQKQSVLHRLLSPVRC